MSYSEKKTDWFGNSYTRHYDRSAKTTGYSVPKTDWFGNKYTKHYDRNWKSR